jgi:hypothetical protein
MNDGPVDGAPGTGAPGGTGAAGVAGAAGGDGASSARPAAGWRSPTFGGEWPGHVADTIEGVVGTFRVQVIRPLMLVARGLVFGVIVGTMALVVAVLLVIGLVRIMTVYLFGGRVWASYLLLGIIFVTSGFVVWSRRHSEAEDAAEAA